ncbi:dehydrogenase [Streptomyces sp. LBUM 1476]|nr:dehydrogenase [Streptomyces sp. LBUM 1476]
MDNPPEQPGCPDCGRALRSLGLVLSLRDADKKRVCRHAWKCSAGHFWWHWADRPAEPLDVCPYPQLFRT